MPDLLTPWLCSTARTFSAAFIHSLAFLRQVVDPFRSLAQEHSMLASDSVGGSAIVKSGVFHSALALAWKNEQA
jgi:hypothetical protein